MEYEIGDDPQGVPEHPEAVRDGGLREPLFFRKERVWKGSAQLDEAEPANQLGELV